jgi:hypothetical protein
VLAADGMEGRDAGSAGHRKAAEYVAGRFAACGLMAAGEAGFYQSVPLHSVRSCPIGPRSSSSDRRGSLGAGGATG